MFVLVLGWPLVGCACLFVVLTTLLSVHPTLLCSFCKAMTDGFQALTVRY